MLPLVLIFVLSLVITFTILLVATRPSKHRILVSARLNELGLSKQAGQDEKKADELLKEPDEKNLAAFDKLLSTVGGYDRLKQLIKQADSNSTPSRIVFTSVCLAGIGFFVASFFVSLLPIKIGASGIMAMTPISFLRFRRSRRLNSFNSALPDAIDLMARALRAGHSVASAIEVVSEQAVDPVASEFGIVYQQQNFGLPFRDALTNLASRIASKDLQFVITAMLVQKETGGNLAEILDRTTHVIRERLRIQGEVRIKSAQGRLTGWILTLLPIMMGFLINLVNSGFEKPLFEEPLGHIMLYAGAGMLVVGGLLIRKIVNIEV